MWPQKWVSASNACSLILVDRTLDLCSATRHDSDSVLDRILAVLPRLPGHSNDVAVNMSPICSAKTETAIADNLIPPGCLSQPNSEQCLQIFESLVSKRQKDVMLSLHQHLAAMTPSSREERGPKLATRITPMTLDKQVGSFKNHSDKIAQCAGLLQQTLAVTQTLRSPRIAQLEVIVSVEKLLLQNLGTSRDGAAVLAQMTQLIKTRRERNLPLEDLLVVLVHLYSLAGTDITFSSQAEMLVQSAVQAALFQDRETLEGFLSMLVESNMDEEAVGEVTLHIFNKLKSAAKSRKDLTKYRFEHDPLHLLLSYYHVSSFTPLCTPFIHLSLLVSCPPPFRASSSYVLTTSISPSLSLTPSFVPQVPDAYCCIGTLVHPVHQTADAFVSFPLASPILFSSPTPLPTFLRCSSLDVTPFVRRSELKPDPRRKRGQRCDTFTIVRGRRVEIAQVYPLLSSRSLFESRGSSQPAVHTGLLRQLVADLLDPTRPELPDLSCKSAGLKELLKTGFSLLLNMPRQQHPLDHPMVVIFVVGGITAQEVRHIQEAVADSGLATKVLVGSTRLIMPLDTARALFQGHTA
uniref:Sec1 family domain-containing protein 2 n=1 Tax=Timema monikensis TaxID=170555 RepID=A0A7R9E7A1_9NEOP|nr:unnamed protein product [Timema monikensis]